MATNLWPACECGRLYIVDQVPNEGFNENQERVTFESFARENGFEVLPLNCLVVGHWRQQEDGYEFVVVVSWWHHLYRQAVWIHPLCVRPVVGPLSTVVRRTCRTGRLQPNRWPTDHRSGMWDAWGFSLK